LQTKKLHIISFDVPYPADYGGVIDVYYRIKALYELDFKIHLHCFQYGREESSKLNEICEKVSYYPRNKRLFDLFHLRPFIVQTRISTDLETNLLKDNYPILLEGLHCIAILENKAFNDRITFVRTHNIEHDYYNGLSKTNNLKDFFYFKLEAFKLKRYESMLKKASAILAIQEEDQQHFKTINSSTHLLPVCFDDQKEMIQQSTLPYILFQGNLSVKENIEAISWVLENVWKNLNEKPRFIIAGKNPTSQLKKILNEEKIELIENPSHVEMEKLIQEARIHLLYSKQATGAKLKVINALQSNGHLLVNSLIIEGANLSELCTICDTPEAFQLNIQNLFDQELSSESFQKRKDYFEQTMNVVENCRVIEALI
jgi:glycosyltransferase involved in cell wall biosynthesis